MSDNENTLSKTKKNKQLDNMDEQILTKKKKKLKRSKSASDKQKRRVQHKEGRNFFYL